MTVPSPDVMRLFDLHDRVAIVTGASAGLGARLAEGLAGSGARVAVVARRAEQLQSLAGAIGGMAVAADLSLDAEPQRVVDEVAAALGPPEILVNAAGSIFTHSRAEDEPADIIHKTLQLNLIAPFQLAQAVYPHMLKVGRGSIINISSISGHVGIPGIPQASYAASKLGLSGLTTELAVQWARQSIRINTVAPGFFRSEMTADFYDDERGGAWIKKNTPLPCSGDPEDFVGVVLLLAADGGRYLTGQTIVVDGGWTAR